ncbi:MAG: PKD domain-containing protein [Bacteroidetes bacterium]|nr:PKD domain-containing protein [Bacteroidota bacterium]
MKKRDGTGIQFPVQYLFFLALFNLALVSGAFGQVQANGVFGKPHAMVPLTPHEYRFVHKDVSGGRITLTNTTTSSCSNSDFSLGNFTNWSGCYGTWCDSSRTQTRCAGSGPWMPFEPPCDNNGMPWYNNPTGGHFSIQNPGTDNCITALQKVFPGDAHSALIGNRVCGSGGGGYVDQLTYQITYDPNNSFFIYRCAVVLVKPTDQTHNSPNKRPRFMFSIKDHLTGTIIDPVCGVYDLWPFDGITVWNDGPNNYLWKDWSTIGIDFSTLSGITPGQVLDVVFFVHGCGYTAHTGYAYISAFCGSMSIQVEGCEGSGEVTLTGPPGFTQYEWQGPFCPTCTLPPPYYYGESVTLTAAQGAVTGNYFELNLTALNGCEVNHVQQFIGFTIITPEFTYAGPACVGSPEAFTDLSTINQNQIVNWKWNFGDGTGDFTGVQNPTHTFTTSGTFTVKMVAYSTEGCMDSITHDYTFDPLPTATISGTTTVCRNAASPQMTFTGADAIAPYTFTYKINGGSDLTVTTISGNSVTVDAPTTTAGIFTYSLVSVKEGGSMQCSQAQSGTAIITVLALPTASISGTTTVCQNATDPLITFTGAGAGAPYTFTYTINAGVPQTVTTVSGNSVTVAVPTTIVGTFTYDLVSVQDGTANACSQAQSGSAIVTVSTLPTATISGTIDVCQNSPDPLITFTGAGATEPYTFTYRINGGAPLTVTTSVGSSVTVAAPTTTVGTFTYALVSVQDGSALACSQSQSGNAIVTVNPLPTATISGTIDVCQNATAPLITFTGASATAPYTFTYTINAGAPLTVTTVSGSSVTVAAPTGTVGTFTYDLVSVQEGSSTTCSQAQSGSAIVMVNPLPTATIAGTTAVCQNASDPLITFTGGSHLHRSICHCALYLYLYHQRRRTPHRYHGQRQQCDCCSAHCYSWHIYLCPGQRTGWKYNHLFTSPERKRYRYC